MKTRVSKPPAVQAKKNSAFFAKKGEGAFFGASAGKEEFLRSESGGGTSGAVQCKLTVGQPNDVYEKEADATADKIVQRLAEPGKEKAPVAPAAGLLQKKPIFESEADPKEEPVQRKEAGSGAPGVTPSVESGIRSSKGGGSPLPAATRQQMESGLGADLSGVRIHTDGSAGKMNKDLNAQAFTHGKDVYFNSGKYNPASTGGKHLLAHELTHVVQQNNGLSRKPDISLKTAGTAVAAPGNATPAQAPVMSAPTVQMAPGGGSGSTDIKDMDPADVAAIGKTNEGYIDKEKKEGPAKVHFDNFPFKQYAGDFLTKDKQGNEYTAQKPYLKPTEERKTKQGPVWRKAALPLVTETLKDTVSRKNIKGPNFLLTVKKSDNLRVTGTVDQLAQQVTVPFWDKDGNPVNHQIEHKIDWQVSGGNHNVDVISNLLLLQGAENLRIGLVVMGNMKEAYNKIIAFYKKNKVTGLVESFEDAKGVYPIWTENLALTGLPVTGSMYTLTQMQKGDTGNPLDDKVVDVIDEKLNPGELVLRTSQKGGGNVVRYDFNNKFMEIKGNADKHELTSITLKDVVKDDKGNLDQTKPNKTLDFTKESQDHYKVKTDGFALYLKDTIRGMKNLSEIVWSDVEFDPFTGWYANGQVNTTVPFLDKANITVTLESSVFTLEATITSTALQGKLPSPFNIDYCSLSLIASSDLEFAVGGEVGFSIGKDGNQYGKGHIGGKAGTAGFQLDGGFEFDKKYFTGNLSVNYEKNGVQENWKIGGSINLKKNVIKNVDSLKIDFSYGTNATGGKTLSGSGTAMLSLPGIKSIGITASLDDKGVFTIGGTFDLNDLPKLKGGKGRIIVTKSGDDWDIDVQGSVKPDLDIKFLTLDEVAVSYHKGVFDIHSGAKFEKGKISGNFTVGVTNQPVSKDGQMTPGTGGKDLKFYASGQINVDIVEGVGGLVGIKITPEGDILLNGEVGLTKDKELFSMPPLNENVFTLSQNIPLASCGIVTLSLHFGGKVDIYAHLNPLTFDKGSNIGLTNVSLKDFSHAKITSHLSVSSHLDAGIVLGLELGLDAALLGILHGTVKGTGDLDFRALDAGLTVTFGAEWSADQGAKLTEGEMKVHLASKLIASLGATAEVTANLLFTTITLWSHHWDLAQKEWKIGLFGSGDLTIPLPIGNDGKISMTPKDIRGQLNKLEGAVNNDNMSKNSMNLMEGKGVTDEDQTSQSSEVIQKEVIARFTDPVRFEFNKSVNYIQERYKLVNYLRSKIGEEQKIDLSYVEGLIKKCEFEEYEKFGPYIQAETFPSDTKYLLIDDFMVNHPTLGAAEKANLRSNVVPDKKDDKDSNVQKKEIGPEPVIMRKAETDGKGNYTGNYIFDPGHDGLDAGFFNKVKKGVADGVLDDNEIKALRADAIGRNGTVMHAEQLLMAAMRNPVNVTRMKAYTGGSLIIPMSDIKESDKNYLTNFGVEKNPLDTSAYIARILASVFGLSKEKVADILTEYDNKAAELIHKYAGKQFSDQADRLIVYCEDKPVVPWDDVIGAMLNGAADSTEGDRIMAGTVYALASKVGHSTAPRIRSGELKIDALVPAVYERIAGDGEASYQYSTDEDVLKSDTVYIKTDLDIFRLRSQALVIHELTHAADDFAATGSTSTKEDSLKLETHAYKEQGRYMMDQIMTQPAGSGPGYLNAASQYAHDSPLYYWSMVAAAKDDVTKYEATLVSINTNAPMTKTAAAVKADLALSAADLERKVRDALVAYRTSKGKQLYTPGTTTLGGPGGHYFVQRSPDPTTTPASMHIQRDEEGDKKAGISTVLEQKYTLGGDVFKIKINWAEGFSPKVLFIKMSYAGPGQSDKDILSTTDNYMGEPKAPVPVVIPGKPDEIQIDWFNDRKYIITVSDVVKEDPKWSPPMKIHDLAIEVNGKIISRGGTWRIKAAGAIPTTMKETVSGIGVPKDDKPIFNPVAALMTARTRIAALNAEKSEAQVWDPLLTQMDKDIDFLQKNTGKLSPADELKWSTTANDFNSSSRDFIAIIDQLDRYDRKESYPEDIADEAIQIVDFTKGQFRTAIFTAYGGKTSVTAALREQAQLAFAALPYKISALYLKKGAALEAQLAKYKELREQLNGYRGMNGRAVILCNADSYFASGALQFRLQQMIESLRNDLFSRAEGELTDIMNLAMSVQVYRNVLALMTIYEQFIYFDNNIPWLTSSKKTRQDIAIYRVRLRGYFDRINTVLIAGDPIDNETFSSVLKDAIADFAVDVNDDKFKTLLNNINDDFQEYAMVKAVVKGVFVMLVVVAAASATGGVAGAAMGGVMEGLGAGETALAFGATTFAEALAFTGTSRYVGDVMGMKSDDPFIQDLVTNWLMFGYMKKAAQLYEGVTAALKASGRLTAFKVASSTAGKLSFSIAALQAFSVAQQIGKGKLSGAEFGKSLFFNTILTSVLHFGRFATEPLEKKTASFVREYVVKNFAGELGNLEKEREALKVLLAELNANKATAPDKVPDALQRTKELAEKEMRLVNRAGKAKGLTGEALAKLTQTYIQKIDEANLRLAQLGVDTNTGARPLFREVKPGIVAYEDSKAGEVEETLKNFYKEGGGDVKKTDTGFVGKMGAERVVYVPESSQAAKTGLVASAGARTAKPADALEYIKLRLSAMGKRGLEIVKIEHKGDEKVLGILKGMEDAGKDVDKALRDYISDDEIDQMSRDQMKKRVADTGDELALRRYKAKSDSIPDDTRLKDILKGMKSNHRSLVDRLHDEQATEEAKIQKEADLKQLATDSLVTLKSKGFFHDPKVLEFIKRGEPGEQDLRGAMAEFMAKEQALGERQALGKTKGPEEAMTGVEFVKKVPGYKSIGEWRRANPDKLTTEAALDRAAAKYRTGEGQLWKSITEIDYLILQKAAAGSKPAIAEAGQVKSGARDRAEAAKDQNTKAQDAVNSMLAGDTSIQAFLRTADTGVLGENVSNKIDFSTLKTSEKMTVGPEGKTGFDRSLGLRTEDLDGMAKDIIKDPDKFTK